MYFFSLSHVHDVPKLKLFEVAGHRSRNIKTAIKSRNMQITRSVGKNCWECLRIVALNHVTIRSVGLIRSGTVRMIGWGLRVSKLCRTHREPIGTFSGATRADPQNCVDLIQIRVTEHYRWTWFVENYTGYLQISSISWEIPKAVWRIEVH